MELIKHKCYVFETKELAQDAIDLINIQQGLPVPNVISYCTISMIDEIITITHDAVVENVLGDGWVIVEQEINEL